MVYLTVQLPAGFVFQPEIIGINHHSGRVADHYEGKPTLGGIPDQAARRDAERYIAAGTPQGYPREQKPDDTIWYDGYCRCTHPSISANTIQSD